MDKNELLGQLARLSLTEYAYFEQIGSTNDSAKDWLAEGKPGIYAVVANQQTAGRGREERRWESPANSAIALSLGVPANELSEAILPLLGGLVGAAVGRAIKAHVGLDIDLKWPNDLLVEGKKIGGILIENAWEGNQFQGSVIGIGINVASASIEKADRFRFPAGSLEDFLASLPDRNELALAIIGQLLVDLKQAQPREILDLWIERLAFRGDWIDFQGLDGSSLRAKVLGIDESGGLIVEMENGLTRHYTAGEIQFEHS